MTMKRHGNRTVLRLEQLEQRDVPSTMLLTSSDLTTVPTNSTNGPVTDIRLRRIVSDVATGPSGTATQAVISAPIHAATPTESISINF
jgi:hypothetical protein